MNIHASSTPMNNHINEFSCWYIEQRRDITRQDQSYVIFPQENRIDPDQAALTRAS